MPISRRMKRLSLLVGLSMVALSLAPAAAHAVIAASVPGTTCAVFPADSIWNTDISTLPVHANSAKWLKTMHAATTNLHPDFGPPNYGMPFDVVDNAHSTTSISFQYTSESDPGPYPFDANTRIENGSDAHALMINSETCILYELFGAKWNSGSPSAGSGAIFDLGSNALREDGWTSADAAGLPIFPGLLRFDEVQAGAIDHAIRFTVACTSRHYLWPARHQAGSANAKCPPMGARFRLKSTFKVASFSPDARVVLRAMKHYGLILADNGSDWYFQGTLDSGWTNSLLDQLKRIPASAFQAVSEGGCQVAPDSAQSSC
jgi:hypothetical protein